MYRVSGLRRLWRIGIQSIRIIVFYKNYQPGWTRRSDEIQLVTGEQVLSGGKAMLTGVINCFRASSRTMKRAGIKSSIIFINN